MTDEKQPPNLVSIDCGKKEEELEVNISKEALLGFVEKLLDMVDNDEVTHLVCTYEAPNGDIASSFVGTTDNYFRFFWSMKEVVMPQYENFYLIDHSEDEYE